MNMTVGITSSPSRSDDAVHILCKSLPLNCTFINYNSTEYGTTDENGTGTGMIGAVQRGEIDTVQPIFTPTYARYRAVDFSHAYFYIDIVIATRTPTASKGGLNFKFVTALKWETWSVLIATMVLVSAFLAMMTTGFFNTKKGFFQWVLDALDHGAALVTNKHRLCVTALNIFKPTITFWSLSAMVLSSAYTSLLFSDKMKNPGSVPFTDFDSLVDCVEGGGCQLITHSPTLSYMQTLTSTENSAGQRLSASFKTHPLLQAPAAKIPQMILGNTDTFLVWLTSKTAFDSVIANNYDCKFYVINGPFQDIWSFPVRKKSRLVEILNRGGAPFVESGLEKALSAKYDKDWTMCNPGSGRVGRNSALESGTMIATFYFYGIAIGLCMLVFFAEVGLSKIVIFQL